MALQNSAPNSLDPSVAYGEHNQTAFAIQQAINKLQTCTLVEIMAVHNDGEVSAVGLVDIRPMVAQVDASGKGWPHGTIYNVPYFRLQGGSNAIILDPQVGDIGMACFASRDISQIKTTKKRGMPGSGRVYDPSDALYLGGFLNGVPTQYVRFSASGIVIHSPSVITIEAPTVTITGAVNVTGTLSATGEISAVGKNLSTHVHGGVQPGAGTTGAPV